jgi:hypothetical protein
MQSKAKQSIA